MSNRIVSTLGLSLFLAFAAAAQPTSGSIVGRVLDPSGSLVPGASVRAENEATGLAESTTTDAAGAFVLPALPPGTYRLTVEKQGFRTATSPGLRLPIAQKLEIQVELSLAPGGHVVEMVKASVLQTQSAAAGEGIDSRQIVNLPLLGRNFLELARLTSGVVNGSGGNTLNLAVNGQREFANSVLVDGVEATANRNNDTTIRPSVDAVEEFKLLTSGYEAEYGHASGAVVAIQTRSGTNQLHGDAYEFIRPRGAAARTFFAPHSSPLQQHNFGGTLGGPLRADRTFFFASYEGVRQRNAFSFLDSVPPAGQIRYLSNGDVDLSGLKDPLTGKQIPIFDPSIYAAYYYSSQFPGNIIPAARISKAGTAVLQNFFPAPTRPGILNGWFNNFVSSQAYLFDSDNVTGRLDHLFSAADRLSATYYYGSFLSHTGDRFAGAIPVAGGGDADYGDDEHSRSQELAISETHLFSAHWLNEARAGYTRYRLDQLNLLDNQSLAAQFGLGNINVPGLPETLGFPDIYLGFGAQTGGSTYKPLHFLDSNLQLTDSLSLNRSGHEVKIGAQYRNLVSHPFFSLFPTGFQYYGGPGVSLTSDPNYGFYDPSAFYYNGGSDIADLLLGLPYTVNIGAQLTNPVTHSGEWSAFAQDTWRIAPRLVLSLGLRYEYAAPWTEASNNLSNFDTGKGLILLAGRGGNSRALVQPDRNNFAPRLGLAWHATDQTVVRAGWGIFYSPENDAREDLLTKNYPFNVQQTFFNNIYGGLPFAYSLDTGVPRVTSVPAGSAAATLDPAAVKKATGAAQNLFLVDPNLRTGYSQLFHVTIQRQITGSLNLEAGYSGSLSRKLPYAVGNWNLNNRLASSLGQVQALFSEGSGDFHSLQVKAERHFAAGARFLVAYTLGKNMDNGPAPFNLGHNQNSHNQPQSPFDLALERAPADGDVRHTFVGSFVYDLPFGKGRRSLSGLHGWGQALLGGWQADGIFVRRSGLPVNVVRNSAMTGFEGLRPDLVSNPNLDNSAQTLTRYFATSAFSAARFTGSHKTDLGNAGRNLVRGPGLINLDFSLIKTIPVAERLAAELRFEFFNLTNTPHFANPDGNMSDGSFGSITQTTGNPRIVQFAAKVRW